MSARADQAYSRLLKPLSILIVVISIVAIAWPFYRKFFINEWRERIAASEPVVFIPDCPVVSAQLRCGDRYTVVFRKNENNQWCDRVRKNKDPEGPESCGRNIDAWDFARSWRYFTVEGLRLYYSWRGRVIFSPNPTSPNQVAGWLVTPETLARRSAHPLSIQ